MAVPMPRSALMAGSRGPHAETAIPPSPNAVVTVHRQRTRAGRSVPDMALLTHLSAGTGPSRSWPGTASAPAGR